MLIFFTGVVMSLCLASNSKLMSMGRSRKTYLPSSLVANSTTLDVLVFFNCTMASACGLSGPRWNGEGCLRTPASRCHRAVEEHQDVQCRGVCHQGRWQVRLPGSSHGHQFRIAGQAQ